MLDSSMIVKYRRLQVPKLLGAYDCSGMQPRHYGRLKLVRQVCHHSASCSPVVFVQCYGVWHNAPEARNTRWRSCGSGPYNTLNYEWKLPCCKVEHWLNHRSPERMDMSLED